MTDPFWNHVISGSGYPSPTHVSVKVPNFVTFVSMGCTETHGATKTKYEIRESAQAGDLPSSSIIVIMVILVPKMTLLSVVDNSTVKVLFTSNIKSSTMEIFTQRRLLFIDPEGKFKIVDALL